MQTLPAVCCPELKTLEVLEHKITTIEIVLAELQSSNAELTEWLRNGKLSMKIASKSFSALGCLINWCIKIFVASSMLYATWQAYTNGYLPPIDLFISHK